MAENRNSPGNEPTGLNLKKFNSTSVTTTTEVITPKLSSADKGRRALMIVVALFAIVFLGAIAFRNSGFNPFEKTDEEKAFAAPVHTSPQ